uniref:Uncharacterized protein n=1 Tax=viral metagenome TaxID=1070528 RepID=A0A6M3JWD7_9ZZZZ
MVKLKEITYAELKKLRLKQLEKQKYICPILKQVLDIKDSVFDHKHKNKKEVLGEDGKGLLRGVIHFQANVMEGKIAKLYKRYGLHKFISLPELLRNIASYIEHPPMKPEYIHPNERVFKKISKREYNLIRKYYFKMYPKRKKLPMYPKSGKITKELEALLEKVNKLNE